MNIKLASNQVYRTATGRCLLALMLSSCLFCNRLSAQTSPSAVPADRWLEIDLYWFNKDNLEQSADAFWQRFAPLYAGVDGWRGVVVNVGWTADYIYEWKGNLTDRVPLPTKMVAERFKDHEPLGNGSTTERMAVAKKRYASLDQKEVTYARWTYGDLKRLCEALRDTAGRKYGLTGIKVGMLELGWARAYDGKPGLFAQKQPQVYDLNGWETAKTFDVRAKLNRDDTPYAAFPKGVAEGTPISEFFAAQWGSFSKMIGVDALVLRDSMIGPGVYHQLRGPFGGTASTDPALVADFSLTMRQFVKAVKLANTNALVIGYSSANSAVADWRVNCVDLEALALDGYLDAYIDQSWAGAWNEVGQRNESFWNAPLLGWTYQVAYTLAHGAMLAKSKVRHYTLVDTFDAWEPWDTIHTAPDRLRWEIWALLHAGVKTPTGLKFPTGSYISWANQSDTLLSPADVEFLTTNLNAAVLDAQQTKDIYGPTLVYSRSTMAWLAGHTPAQSIKEWMDQQAGSVMKWSVPILSITRTEFLPQVSSDMFILQTPVHLSDSELAVVSDLIKSGRPVAVWGSPAGGIDERIATLLGITTRDQQTSRIERVATLTMPTASGRLGTDVPESFALYQAFSTNQAAAGVSVVYEVEHSPALAIRRAGGVSAMFWDPPDLAANVKPNLPAWNIELPEEMGSPYPFVLAARTINELLKADGRFCAEPANPLKPVALAIWERKDGTCAVLAGDMEEGFCHQSYQDLEVALDLQPKRSGSQPANVTQVWSGNESSSVADHLDIRLGRMQSKLYMIDKTQPQ